MIDSGAPDWSYTSYSAFSREAFCPRNRTIIEHIANRPMPMSMSKTTGGSATACGETSGVWLNAGGGFICVDGPLANTSLFSQRFIEIHIVTLKVRAYANKISVIGAENVVMTWRGGE